MAKKEFLKRMGQVYALSIQYGLTEQELNLYIEEQFKFLYNKKHQEDNYEKAMEAT